MFSLPPPLSAPNSRPMQGGEQTRGQPSVTPTPQSAGAWGPQAGDTVLGMHRSPRRGGPSPGSGRYTGSSRDSRGKPARLEKGRPGERQTPLPVWLHLLHVAHSAPATAPGAVDPKRLTVIAALHQPLSVGFSFFLRCANKSTDANFSLLSKLCFSPTSEQAIGEKKESKIRNQVPSR